MGQNTDAFISSKPEADGICSRVDFYWTGRLDDILNPQIKQNLLININKHLF
jgi:hypothetical protein